MIKNDVYKIIPDYKYITQALKTFEDEVLYDKVGDWSEIKNYFDTILPEEKDFGIKDEDLERWHKILKEYCSKSPSDESTNYLITSIGYPKEVSDEIISIINNMRTNTKLREIINTMYADWDFIVGSRYIL